MMDSKCKLICSSSAADFYAHPDGYVVKVSRKTGSEKIAGTHKDSNRQPMVCLAGTRMSLKDAIAKAFLPGYHDGIVVWHKDGNPFNCCADNLAIATAKRQLKRYVQPGTPLEVIKNGKGETFPSISTAAFDLDMEPGTLGYRLKRDNGKTIFKDGTIVRRIK